MAPLYVESNGFLLAGGIRVGQPGQLLRIYIEGDGRAWVSRDRPSSDPTPREALAFKLAQLDPAPNVAYLARPCQYTLHQSMACSSAYWTDRRFSTEVVSAMNQAVEVAMQHAHTGTVELVGYSGGGAIAVLIAARRQDIARLRTVAGNLDSEAINRWHKVSSMPGSLNPIDAAERISRIPQRHFIGDRDKIVPPFIAEAFQRETNEACRWPVTLVMGASHDQGWLEHWPALLQLPFDCAAFATQ